MPENLPHNVRFAEALHVLGLPNAAFFASELFFESFGHRFPVPRDNCGLPIATPPQNWRQYVAFYKWASNHIEPVGFCNWIRYDDVYLEGGMCVRKDFYRRLPKDQWAECKARGGVAQIIMEIASGELNDCAAWFGYCGDKKAFIVDSRVGYKPTEYQYLIVKWFRDVPLAEKRRLERIVAAIGPF
jgi:hypothetical protein